MPYGVSPAVPSAVTTTASAAFAASHSQLMTIGCAVSVAAVDAVSVGASTMVTVLGSLVTHAPPMLTMTDSSSAPPVASDASLSASMVHVPSAFWPCATMVPVPSSTHHASCVAPPSYVHVRVTSVPSAT